jgi:hypothetical protein
VWCAEAAHKLGSSLVEVVKPWVADGGNGRPRNMSKVKLAAWHAENLGFDCALRRDEYINALSVEKKKTLGSRGFAVSPCTSVSQDTVTRYMQNAVAIGAVKKVHKVVERSLARVVSRNVSDECRVSYGNVFVCVCVCTCMRVHPYACVCMRVRA